MKKRVSIYIESEVWEGLKESAWKRRESASGYLEKLIKSGGKNFTNEPKLRDNQTGETVAKIVNVATDDDIKVLAKKQAELDAKKTAADRIREKAGVIKKDVESPRAKYKRLHPREMCPMCRERNKDCICGG